MGVRDQWPPEFNQGSRRHSTRPFPATSGPFDHSPSKIPERYPPVSDVTDHFGCVGWNPMGARGLEHRCSEPCRLLPERSWIPILVRCSIHTPGAHSEPRKASRGERCSSVGPRFDVGPRKGRTEMRRRWIAVSVVMALALALPIGAGPTPYGPRRPWGRDAERGVPDGAFLPRSGT